MKNGAGLWVLVSAIGVASAFLAGTLLATPAPVPPSITANGSSSKYTLTAQSIADQRDVKIRVNVLQGAELRTARSGVVTSFACRAGDSFVSWGTNVSVDGSPLLNLASTTPFWRDLAPGNRGADVLALQAELNRIGLDIEADGVLGESSVRAINARLTEIGADVIDSTIISRSSLVWLPNQSAVAQKCSLSIGQSLNDGASIATLAPSVVGAAVETLPENMIAGERVIRINDETLRADTSGSVSEGDLATLAATGAFGTAVSEAQGQDADAGLTGNVTIDGVLELSSPVDAWAVPPGSLTSVVGNSGCVHDGSTAFAVSIVSSELGKAFVTFSSAVTPPLTIDAAPNRARPCE